MQYNVMKLCTIIHSALHMVLSHSFGYHHVCHVCMFASRIIDEKKNLLKTIANIMEP